VRGVSIDEDDLDLGETIEPILKDKQWIKKPWTDEQDEGLKQARLPAARGGPPHPFSRTSASNDCDG
jgi:hypothetical protein